MVRLEGGGHQQVLPRGQGEALRHLPQVDVGFAASLGRVVAEEIFPHVVFIFWRLDSKKGERSGLN